METIAETSKAQKIIAVETDDEDDVIPGPSSSATTNGGTTALEESRGSTSKTRGIFRAFRRNSSLDDLQQSTTPAKWVGAGIAANAEDVNMDPVQFAAGCNLLQYAAQADNEKIRVLLESKRTHVNFRDYDRRTALHVASSEGNLETVQYLIEVWHAKIHRSDRWGGSPLDDAHRHRHLNVVEYLRSKGATTGTANRLINFIKAAAEGDLEEVQTILRYHGTIVDQGDYDNRTALHLAASNGHLPIVKLLCEAKANVNAKDRWNRQPLDDAVAPAIVAELQSRGATRGAAPPEKNLDSSIKRAVDNMKVQFDELEMIDRIGSGAFGEIYKCRWRGTLVAAKIIRSAKIQRFWTARRLTEALASNDDRVDDAIRELDNQGNSETIDGEELEYAIADFRREISVLKSLR